VHTGGKIGHSRTHEHRAHGYAPRNPFGHSHQVRLQVIVLTGKHAPGARKARLHLVHDQERAVVMAETLHGPQIVSVPEVHSSLPLNHLEDHGGRLLRDCLLHPFEVAIGHMGNARNERLKGFTVLPLPGNRKRPHGTPVEPPLSRHQARPSRA